MLGPQWAGTGVLGALMEVAVRPGSQGGPSGEVKPLLISVHGQKLATTPSAIFIALGFLRGQESTHLPVGLEHDTEGFV